MTDTEAEVWEILERTHNLWSDLGIVLRHAVDIVGVAWIFSAIMGALPTLSLLAPLAWYAVQIWATIKRNRREVERADREKEQHDHPTTLP